MDYETLERKSQSKTLVLDMNAPDQTCRNCGEDLSEYMTRELHVVAMGVTLCPKCFWDWFLRGGKK